MRKTHILVVVHCTNIQGQSAISNEIIHLKVFKYIYYGMNVSERKD